MVLAGVSGVHDVSGAGQGFSFCAKLAFEAPGRRWPSMGLPSQGRWLTSISFLGLLHLLGPALPAPRCSCICLAGQS